MGFPWRTSDPWSLDLRFLGEFQTWVQTWIHWQHQENGAPPKDRKLVNISIQHGKLRIPSLNFWNTSQGIISCRKHVGKWWRERRESQDVDILTSYCHWIRNYPDLQTISAFYVSQLLNLFKNEQILSYSWSFPTNPWFFFRTVVAWIFAWGAEWGRQRSTRSCGWSAKNRGSWTIQIYFFIYYYFLFKSIFQLLPISFKSIFRSFYPSIRRFRRPKWSQKRRKRVTVQMKSPRRWPLPATRPTKSPGLPAGFLVELSGSESDKKPKKKAKSDSSSDDRRHLDTLDLAVPALGCGWKRNQRLPKTTYRSICIEITNNNVNYQKIANAIVLHVSFVLKLWLCKMENGIDCLRWGKKRRKKSDSSDEGAKKKAKAFRLDFFSQDFICQHSHKNPSDKSSCCKLLEYFQGATMVRLTATLHAYPTNLLFGTKCTRC